MFHIFFTDHVHNFRHIRLRAALINNGYRQTEDFSVRTGNFDSAHIGGNDREIAFADQLPQGLDENGLGIQVIKGNINEALNLGRM